MDIFILSEFELSCQIGYIFINNRLNGCIILYKQKEKMFFLTKLLTY